MKSNYLQFTPDGVKRYNRTEEQMVNVDITKIRKAEAEFEVGDGLLPVQKLARTDVMSSAMQWIQNDPELRAGYNLPPMFSYMMKVQGVDKLTKFEKPDQQRQYEQQVAAWRSTAIEYSKLIGKPMGENKVFMPEDIAKVIGPMPPPPQTGTPNPNATTP